MQPVTLSVLIPAYDCEDVVDDAIVSALAQELAVDFEVVAVDDGSTDSTAERLRAWAAREPARVTVGFHERNRGGSAARNTAAELAAGDLLYMLDADNVLPPDCVASQLDLMNATGLQAVSVGQMYYFEGSTENVVDGWVMRHADGRSTLRHLFETVRVPASHGNYLYSRRLFEAVGGYSEDAGAADAWTFGLKHLARGFDIAVDRRSYYLHRLNRGVDSYWQREQHLGTNDRNAVRELRRESDRLPQDLRRAVAELRPDDMFFSLVALGAFRSDIDHLRHVRRRFRVEQAAHAAVGRVTSRARRLRGRA
jgi:glycosyltransferase involved in cell wall biosynthesis